MGQTDALEIERRLNRGRRFLILSYGELIASGRLLHARVDSVQRKSFTTTCCATPSSMTVYGLRPLPTWQAAHRAAHSKHQVPRSRQQDYEGKAGRARSSPTRLDLGNEPRGVIQSSEPLFRPVHTDAAAHAVSRCCARAPAQPTCPLGSCQATGGAEASSTGKAARGRSEGGG